MMCFAQRQQTTTPQKSIKRSEVNNELQNTREPQIRQKQLAIFSRVKKN